MHFPRLLLAAALFAQTPAAFAEPAADPTLRSPDDIVVEGERLTREEAKKRANAFIRTLGVAPGIYSQDSVARWTVRLCPRALGLSDEHAALVEGWFRDTVRSSGARIADGKCDTNVLLLFVDDGANFIKLFKARYPGQFADMSGPDIRDLVELDKPVRWWYSVRRTSGGLSLIGPQTLRSIEGATIVIDVNDAEGATLRAVTDYAAFVALSGIRIRAEPQSQSILGLFDDRQGKRELTEWDKRFLTALYTIPHERKGRYQRGRLVGALLKPDDKE
ncbi:hypothetical protein AOA14_05155 [Sphingopyxis terrae subsp. terrae NBRC 15098]|uniref:Uncharacterized protein n=1 Tax=Sphingopyxis terrae subsp. terrae NBRC 15098 TaxID=1219058 RepID=A0A142VW01_9SPHN|nr:MULTISPECIES: hypothetical protein [Sphingopyxis]AMU93990.1 hypothetical protein AOA14_05155 [Sphingopyxis terrae subsp. terrae NBRC 15098]QXF11150.1 hypothetical protein HBA51_02485 [Sphingopyxis terrae subsp. terrae]